MMGFFKDIEREAKRIAGQTKTILGRRKVPETPPVPDRTDPSIAAAKRRARRAIGSISRKTVLGGRSGGGETVARKQLLGE